jgi:signal transduction histidine kinase
MAELARECVAVARQRHRLSGEALSLACDSGAWLTGDPNELRTAVSNLLDNAIKYSGRRVRIEVEVRRIGDLIRVRVRDEGVGIPRQELKQIFKRFYRVSDAITQRVKGTGLGLFIVTSIARRHGGRAYAESEGRGRGSTFTLDIPVGS